MKNQKQRSGYLGGEEKHRHTVTEMDDRKRKRMISNRESVRRSRMKKKKLVEDLTREMTRLQLQNSGIVGRIDEATKGFMVISRENSVLMAQAVELTERLRSLMTLLQCSCSWFGRIPHS